MNYLKTFELFDFFKKKESPEPKSPLERLKWIFTNYKNFKKDKNVYSFRVEDNMAYWYISYMSKTSNFALIIEKSKKEDKYYIRPFEGTKMGDDIDITKSEFEEYSRKLEEMDEFLNQEDEKKNTSTIGEGGLDNLNISSTEEVSYIITDVLKEHVGKEFEFDCMVYTWTSNNANTYEVTPVLFKVSEFKLDVYDDFEDEDSEKDSNYYVQIIVSNNVNNKLYNIWIDENTKAEWSDIKSLATRENAIVLYEYTDHLSRREKRENDRYTYPLIKLGLEVAPTKYNSIELIKHVQEIIMLLKNLPKN